MSEMVKRVAAALREKLDYSGNHSGEAFEDAARAALAAMREPTEPMISSGWDEINVIGCGRDGPVDVWEAMVDRALAVEVVPKPAAPYCMCDPLLGAGTYDMTPTQFSPFEMPKP